MAVSHDPYCDENHQSRQRCNQALAPTPDALNTLASTPATGPLALEVDAEPPATLPASEAVREAVITGAMPAASPYAARAWEDTARALDATPHDDDTRFAARESVPSGPNVPLIVSVLLVVMMLIVLRLRSRQRKAPSGD